MGGDREGAKQAKPGAKAEREARLAAQMRENLKRRKVQARARAAEDDSTDEPSTDGGR